MFLQCSFLNFVRQWRGFVREEEEMATILRLVTFNLENLDDQPGGRPTLADRIKVLQPQLHRLRGDILCLQEVHGQETAGGERTLGALEQLRQNTPYQDFHVAHTVTTEGKVYDKRNLVVLSRFPITSRQQIKHDLIPQPRYQKSTAQPPEDQAKDVTWERPLLYVTIDLGEGRTLHLITVHLKSKIPSDIPGQKLDQYKWRTVTGWAEGFFLSSMKRVGQALEVRHKIDEIFDQEGEQALIAVCGDFNADIDSVPVNAMRGPVEETGNPALLGRIMVPCELSVPEPSRYTLLHLGKGEMLDHILASRGLLTYYRGTEIHNEILPDESGAFRTDVQFPESDHAPVVAEFQLP
jgi:endonuclease/exonuclease/phosphatase family metal-dependent hydrolase